MPPRHVYWTIILEGKPTAFRAYTQEELLPTLKQLQAKHPDAVMKWFARGKLWHTPEEERLAFEMTRSAERRKPTWRPGGEHRDPREQFKIPRDEKRRRFAANLRREKDGPARRSPGGDKPGEGGDPGSQGRPGGPFKPGVPPKPGGPWKPAGPPKPRGPWKPAGPARPGSPGRPGGHGRPSGPGRHPRPSRGAFPL